MPINSRTKGKTGELELSKELMRIFGIECRRGQQFAGGTDSPDVVGLPDVIHPEVKRVEKLNIQAAMQQASRDGGPDKKPVVFHRRNRGDWMVTFLLDDAPEVIQALSQLSVRQFPG